MRRNDGHLWMNQSMKLYVYESLWIFIEQIFMNHSSALMIEYWKREYIETKLLRLLKFSMNILELCLWKKKK